VDYSRTECVQYEDDEYYYYVKAVPKLTIVNADVRVKQINARNTKRARDINDVAKSAHDRNTTAPEQDDDIF
jgi:hypothetical protein